MPKKDFTQIALDIVKQASGEVEKASPSPKQITARKGGLAGGKKRMAALTTEERSELAVKAATARWKDRTPATGVPPVQSRSGKKR